MLCKICQTNETDNTSGICWRHFGAEDRCPKCGEKMEKKHGIYQYVCLRCFIEVNYKERKIGGRLKGRLTN